MFDDEALQKWFARAEKKGPYYLFHQEPYRNYCYGLPHAHARWPGIENWQKYWLIWQETSKGVTKTKLATVEDGFCARYGFNTLGVLTGKSVTGLWQASSNSVTEEQLQAMLDVANGKTNLPTFNLHDLQDFSW